MNSDMETRKATREQAWSVGSWADTVQDVSLPTPPTCTSIFSVGKWRTQGCI